MSSSKYIQSAVRNVKDYLAKKYPGRAWIKRATAPLPSGYEPNLDVTPELDPEQSSFYQSQIGVLRCIRIVIAPGIAKRRTSRGRIPYVRIFGKEA
jgi:hypothetical protein